MTSLASISLGPYQTGAILLAGLFCYDIFCVFGTDVMITVATSVEAPVKFLNTAPPPLVYIPRVYPFSVLGLGDVVIPGLFVRLMYTADEILQPTRGSYFIVATCAYAAGLLLCFVANDIFHNGQPAVFYLNPSLIVVHLLVQL
jgi:minor histocompatibility antigen H13